MKDPDNLLRKVAAPVAATIIAMLIVVAGWVFVVPRIPDVIPGIGSTTQDIESESAKAEESKKAERPSTRTPWGDPALEAKMRKITGNTSEDFVAEDAFDLTELDLSSDYYTAEDEKIRDISALSVLKNLEKLELQRNRIEKVDALSSLGELKELSLYDNEVSDIKPLTGCNKLESLNLGVNPVADLSVLTKLKSLKKLKTCSPSYSCSSAQRRSLHPASPTNASQELALPVHE